ncbi:MAG: GNAT family protein [Sphingomonadaceae bacterium]|jgi:RimJ/RimL family protein N-acetyltransferase
MSALEAVLEDGNLSLVPFRVEYAEPLREACARDTEIWEIYPVNMLDGDAEAMLKRFHGEQGWVRFVVLMDGAVVGTTSYISPDLANGTVMIGGTYIEPAMRGTDVNRRMKKLMIDHAIDCGFWRIEFTVDTRNTRSMAAMEKLGAVREGILRKNRVTWTGYVRDTALYSILADDWRATGH